MDDVTQYTNQIITRAIETEEDFIFRTIEPWCSEIAERKISKKDLKKALELLKKQEPIEPLFNEHHVYVSDSFMCGACHHFIKFHARYCEDCGRAVKWNEAD